MNKKRVIITGATGTSRAVEGVLDRHLRAFRKALAAKRGDDS